ncbi:MAG: 50S ribosomal protein L9 [Phycisphaerales bacterium]
MARRSVELLLTDNVENLGIVGDIVKVTPGYARNYLLPHGHATIPSPKRIEELQERRKEEQSKLAALRKAREELHARMEDVTISVVRSCNDQGILYGSVSQRDISDALRENGYDVSVRSIRLGQPIRRVGSYPVPVQFEKDLRCEVTFVVEPDHAIGDEREEMEFDNEGRLMRPRRGRKPARDDANGDGASHDDARGEKPSREKRDKSETQSDSASA